MQNAVRRLPTLLTCAALLICALPLVYIAVFAGNIEGSDLPSAFAALALSIVFAFIALIIVAPIALAYALVIYDMKPSTLKRTLTRMIHMLSGVPFVVCAFVVIVPALAFRGGPSVFFAILALILGCAPRACAMLESALHKIPERYRLASLSLGASRRDIAVNIVFKLSGKAMLSCAMTVFAVALDQLALMQIALGFALQMPAIATRPAPSLLLYASATGDFGTAALTALLLLLVGCALSYGARRLSAP